MTAEIISCSACIYRGQVSQTDTSYVCRRRAPRAGAGAASMQDNMRAVWPKVDGNDGCGEGETADAPA